jgi:DNA-binding transcriptional regulator GbsR (MarR family)
VSDHRLQEHAERLAAVFTAAGFPRMSARVLMALMVATDDALTASQLQERLGVSAAAVSGAVRYLESLGMVRRRSHRGSRRELYALADPAWYTASLHTPPFYREIMAMLPDAVAEAARLGADAPLARLEEMRDFLDFMRTRLPQLYEEWVASRGPAQRAARTRGSSTP